MRADAGDEADDRLPASMADLFFALVAVVVFMILALVPAIRAQPARPPQPPDALWRSDIRLDGRRALVLLAKAGGIAMASENGRVVGLDAVLDDAPLRGSLLAARRDGRPVLLAVENDGQEAAFQFDALAAALGIPEIAEVRIDGACRYVLADRLRADCDRALRRGGRT